jgi:plastocyanin
MARIPITAAALAALALAACGSASSMTSSSASSSSSSSSSAVPVVARHATVSISNYKFGPASLTVKPGTKVTFVNHDQTAHTATANGSPAFDSGTIKPGARATVTFSKPGTYPYICQFHAFMHGTVVVR